MPLKEFITYNSQEKEEAAPHRPQRSTRFGRRQKQREGDSLGRRFHWGFHGKGKRQGRVYSLGSGHMSNLSGLWAIEMVSSCLVSGPEML